MTFEFNEYTYELGRVALGEAWQIRGDALVEKLLADGWTPPEGLVL